MESTTLKTNDQHRKVLSVIESHFHCQHIGYEPFDATCVCLHSFANEQVFWISFIVEYTDQDTFHVRYEKYGHKPVFALNVDKSAFVALVHSVLALPFQ